MSLKYRSACKAEERWIIGGENEKVIDKTDVQVHIKAMKNEIAK